MNIWEFVVPVVLVAAIKLNCFHFFVFKVDDYKC